MANPYTNVFQGTPINPAQVSYSSMMLPASISLTWPTELADGVPPLPYWSDVTASPGVTITLPIASNGAPGNAAIFNNVGGASFFINNFSGGNIGSVPPGTSQYVILSDNTTSGGLWRIVQFGASVAVAQAGALAGGGLSATQGLLTVQFNIVQLQTNYTSVPGDKDTCFEWVGGTGQLTLPAIAQVPVGWMIETKNAGTGVFTIIPAAPTLIDGVQSVQLVQTESAFVMSDGNQWITLGRGRAAAFTVTFLSKPIPGNGTIVLTPNEAAATVQEFNGALTGNMNVVYGASPSIYSVFNNTTGTGTLTLQANSGDTGAVIVQGQNVVIRSNGAAIRNSVTVNAGTITQINTGSGLLGGPITTSGTIALGTTGAAAGTYGGTSSSVTLTVNPQGQITSITDTPGLPPGTMVDFAGFNVPVGWLWCVGTAVNRTQYAALFAAIGTLWGTGDGSTTFNIPNLNDRVTVGAGNLYSTGQLLGASTVTIGVTNLPNYQLGVSDPTHAHGVSDGGHGHGAIGPLPSGPTSVQQGGGGGVPCWVGNTFYSTNIVQAGIGIAGAGTGIGIAGAATGITVNSGGSGTPLNIVPLAAGVRKIIKY